MSTDRYRPRGLPRILAALGGVAAILLCLSGSFAHKGHDHNDGERPAAPASAFPRVSAQSELYEIVGILKGNRLAIYLDDFATNEPITDAKVRVTVGDGEPIDTGEAVDGVYGIAWPYLPAAQSVDVVFNISASKGDDLLVGSLAPPQGSTQPPPATAGTARWIAALPLPIRNPVVLSLVTFGLGVLFGHFLHSGRRIPATATGAAAIGVFALLVTVAFGHEGHDHPGDQPAASTAGPMSDAPRRLPDGMAFIAKPTQRLLEVRTVVAKPESVRPCHHPDRARSSAIRTAPASCRAFTAGALFRCKRASPHRPERRKGDVLAQIDPLPAARRPHHHPGEGGRNRAADRDRRSQDPAAATAGRAQHRAAGPAHRCRGELEGLRRRRETLREVRTEPELLRAPTDGVIAVARVMPGQVVQAQDMLFQIVDPSGLWVEALAYGDGGSRLARRCHGARRQRAIDER